jgi:DNA primase catalytic core
MSFPDSFLDEIKLRLPISQVIGRSVSWDAHKGNKAKGDYWACCPFHGEKTPSFHCDDGKGYYHCFGCKASGDHFRFLMEKQGLSFPEAVEQLAREAGLPMPTFSPEEAAREKLRGSLFECCAEAAKIFAANLASDAGTAARAYLESRGVSKEQAMQFRLGYAKNSRSSLFEALRAKGFSEDAIIAAGLAKDPVGSNLPADRFWNRLIFPIGDARGRIVGFGGRALTADQEPRYLNSPEGPLFDKSRLLYNLARSRETEGSDLILCEGYLDAMAFDRDGVTRVVAPMGTAITAEQLMACWKLSDEPALCLDGDEAGQKAAARAMATALPLLKPGKSLSFVTLPKDKDPDDLLRERGTGALKKALEIREPLIDRLWASLIARADVATPERKAKFQQGVIDAAANISDASVRKQYEAELTTRLAAFWKEKGVKPVKPAFEKKPKGEEPPDDGGKTAGPKFGPEDIEAMNQHYAVVIMGQRAAILLDGKDDVGNAIERVRFMNVDAFRLWLANKRAFHHGRWGSHADIWLEDKGRRQFRGLEFTPAPPGQSDSRDGFFNLWRGFDVEPRKNIDLAAPWLNHVLENIASNDSTTYDWVVSWFAWMVQHPRTRIGTSLALRGGMGTGKTITGKIVGSLFPAHYFLIDEPRYLTGQFNSHLATTLLLQVDEGFWAGDKLAEGRLKGLITSEFQMIEYKGIDPVRMPNYVSLLISSNDDWVVPAGLRERRFTVLDMNPKRMQDLKYFAALDACYRAPEARAALLWELAHWKIDEKALRTVPATEGLWMQKLRSFDSYHSWLLEFLVEGGFGNGAEWPEYIECHDLHTNYLKRCEKLGLRHPLNSVAFGIKFRKTLPEVLRGQKSKRWCYVLPGLEAARQTFMREVDYRIDWTGVGEIVVSNEQEADPM